MLMIKRELYLEKLINKKNNGFIKVITGPRRCGKSYLLKEIYFHYLLSIGVKKEQIIIIDLDDDRNIKYRNPFHLSDYIRSQLREKEVSYVFIDEVQKVLPVDNPYLPNDQIGFIDVILGLQKHQSIDLYVTGSNSKMLSSDILTEFRDRGDEVKVLPLTFKEVYQAFGGDKSDAINHYLYYGGMPLVFAQKTAQEKEAYLKNLYQQTYIKDIIERNTIRNEEIIFEELMQIVASIVGSLFSFTKLATMFKSIKKKNITEQTIKRYLDMLVDSYLINASARFDIKRKKYIAGPVKYFYTDVGVRNATINFRQYEENQLMENVIYNELIARGYSVDVGSIEHNYKNRQGISKRKQLAIDFIVNRANEKIYIQATLHLDNQEKKDQEIASLLKIRDSFKKMVVVKDNIKRHCDENGIIYIGLFEFLMSDDL